MSPRPVLAVLGPAVAGAQDELLAARVGALAAAAGWIVLTGGGPGVMAAASRGAHQAGGLTVGIVPTAGPHPGYPNQWVDVPIFTGAGIARNAFNVLSATLAVAIGGGAGTLSEIAMALKSGVECWCVHSWQLAPPPGSSVDLPLAFDDAEEFLAALAERFLQQ